MSATVRVSLTAREAVPLTRRVMKKSACFLVFVLMCCHPAAIVPAQQNPHEHHHSAETRLQVDDDRAERVLTVRHGPVDLPPHAHHLVRPISLLTIPFDGWIVAYRPRLVDELGARLPHRLLHHIDFFNTARLNFLCPRYEEYMFAAGSEMQDWPSLPGIGYRVTKGQRVLVRTMFHNPTDTPFPRTYLEVQMEYRKLADGPLRNFYPAWFSVTGCGPTDYDLRPGENVTAGEFTIPYAGTLLGVGGHMHDYGRRMLLENTTRNEKIATLDARLDPQGRIVSLPTVSFIPRGGYRLGRGDVLRVTATYDNPTGKALPRAAMGIVVGYFLPDDDTELGALVFRPASPRARPLGKE